DQTDGWTWLVESGAVWAGLGWSRSSWAVIFYPDTPACMQCSRSGPFLPPPPFVLFKRLCEKASKQKKERSEEKKNRRCSISVGERMEKLRAGRTKDAGGGCWDRKVELALSSDGR